MTRLRDGSIAGRQYVDPATEEPEPSPGRDGGYHNLLDAIDSALARRDDSDTARVALLQAYATVWAAIGYGIWLFLELLIRLILAIVRALSRRRRDDDGEWTTTMRRKGRPR